MSDIYDWLRRVNSQYSDEEPPAPGEETVTLSGEEAVEVALVLAKYNHALEAEYGIGPPTVDEWSVELLRRAGVDIDQEASDE